MARAWWRRLRIDQSPDLLTPDESAVRPDAETPHEFRRLWDMLTGKDNGWSAQGPLNKACW
ncbi:hypothetical protein C1I93_08350 [Micromonospora endophytica]|uniref:Uncharacterized protein n=1 Tax=Micromonospora endophytica TaxID=515350 RepID=A0A2W2D4M0_9ACTN|nr:hypothetical protein C1I93_08350 [Micromonospora endophytica]RIW40747.1 hypothetical protein D3H59_28230 [Micromonospora endophytica]BCJ56885.1 hypothetical protein Jiend_03070 [Micromonospora endophytica]